MREQRAFNVMYIIIFDFEVENFIENILNNEKAFLDGTNIKHSDIDRKGDLKNIEGLTFINNVSVT